MPTFRHITLLSELRMSGKSRVVREDEGFWFVILLSGVGWDWAAARRPAVSPVRLPNTNPSNRELLAMRLAPWTPVQEASPQHSNPSTVVEPSNCTSTPPIM